MKIVIDIPEEEYERMKEQSMFGKVDVWRKAIQSGTPLSKHMEELKRRLLMEVDGGTDDKYLRYTDVCDRISNTIDTYIKAESEDKE